MSLIRIDYENARAQARQLEQSEQQCSQIAQSIQALRQQLAGVWAGEAADTYDQAAERRLREIRKIQDELSRLAHTIRKAADEFEAAEARTKASMSASGGTGSGGRRRMVRRLCRCRSKLNPQSSSRRRHGLRQQSGAMRAVAVNVSSVLNGLDMQIAATQQVRQSLEALSRRCTTEQTQLEAMTQMLLAASDRFTQTDQKLGHRARGLGEAADAIGAGLAATTLPAVALRGIDRQKCADELGKTFGLRTLRNPVRRRQAGGGQQKEGVVLQAQGRCFGLWQRGQNLCFRTSSARQRKAIRITEPYMISWNTARARSRSARVLSKSPEQLPRAAPLREFRLHSVSLPAQETILQAQARI